MSFADGKWCDDATLVSDCRLSPMHKLILARRVPESSLPAPTTTPTASPENVKKKFVPLFLLLLLALFISHTFTNTKQTPFTTHSGLLHS